MLNFPEKTRCNRRIPKQTFYEHLPMTQKLERAFIDGIANIRLMNIISPVSMNITANEGFKELGVMVINLKTYPLDEYVLEVVDKHLPFYCLYLIEYREKYQAYIGYKEKTAGKTVKISRYFHTERFAYEELPLFLDGDSVEEIYTNFVLQVSGGALEPTAPADLGKSVENSLAVEKLKNQISVLEKKIRSEKQFNRQIELSNQKRALEKQLEELRNE